MSTHTHRVCTAEHFAGPHKRVVVVDNSWAYAIICPKNYYVTAITEEEARQDLQIQVLDEHAYKSLPIREYCDCGGFRDGFDWID